MSNSYLKLLSPFPSAIAEPPASYSLITERHIQAIWMEQKYFKNLVASTGEAIEVISPGIWNTGPGPDFLKAHLIVNGSDLLGDIELHLSPEDWYHHNHHLNERYNAVVLHVFLWESKTLKNVKTLLGNPVLQIGLENHLTVPQSKIVQLIDLDLYPYRKFVGSGKCAQALFSKLSNEKIADLLKIAADWRLTQKRHFLQAQQNDPQLFLSTGIAMALGYKHNTEAFTTLYLWLSNYRHLGEEALLALSLGACGYFHSSCEEKWKESERYCHLKALYMMLAFTVPDIPQVNLCLSQVRPLNHPIRRMVYLAKMLSDATVSLLLIKMARKWRTQWQESGSLNKWNKLKENFQQLLPTYTDTYWNYHYIFEKEASPQFLPLIGLNLKNEIIMNTCLPLLQEEVHDRNNHAEIEAFQAFYDHFPASQTSKTKYLIHRFFGDSPKGGILDKAIHEQGAYQLHRDFCIHHEASCIGCPFVERYNYLFQL